MVKKDYSLISTKNYNFESWGEKFPNHQVNLKDLYINSDWEDFFNEVKKDKRFQELEDFLSNCLKVTEGKVKMYPYPDLVFSAFNATPLKKIKVVVIGQDPYHKNEIHSDLVVPQAMGMSFSVPIGIKVPSSLRNIYRNMVDYGHLSNLPTHGNLEFWAYQGVLMINTALTVQHGYPNSHKKYWNWMTDKLIKYISDKTNGTIFVLWGRPAYSKLKYIDDTRHKIIASSHPSGLSYNKKMGNQSSFKEQDHFKLINNHLKKNKRETIVWDL